MRFLIITQAVDQQDPVLGFFHAWINAFATEVESIEVICLREGRHDLPSNVRVHSLGKERGVGRIRRALRLLVLIVGLRNRYDAVFAHMNPEYVVAGGPLWRLMGKEIGFWYAHGAVTPQLRIASSFADHIFTSTPEGYGLRSKKLHIVGQGIDTERFNLSLEGIKARGSCVSVSRLSRSKDIKTAILTMALLREEQVPATLRIVGTPLTNADTEYVTELQAMIEEKGLADVVSFAGGMPNHELPHELHKHRFLINAYKNKSLDKVLLEAMAAGVIPVSSNKAFCALLEKTTDAALKGLPLCVPEGDAAAFKDSISSLYGRSDEDLTKIGRALRAVVVREHGLQGLIARIMSVYRSRV